MSARFVRRRDALVLVVTGEPEAVIGREDLAALLSRQEAVNVYRITDAGPEQAGRAFDSGAGALVVRLANGQAWSAPLSTIAGARSIPAEQYVEPIPSTVTS